MTTKNRTAARNGKAAAAAPAVPLPPPPDELLMRWAWLASVAESLYREAESFRDDVRVNPEYRQRVSLEACNTFAGNCEEALNEVTLCVPSVIDQPR